MIIYRNKILTCQKSLNSKIIKKYHPLRKKKIQSKRFRSRNNPFKYIGGEQKVANKKLHQ